jgi:hypothetical protein
MRISNAECQRVQPDNVYEKIQNYLADWNYRSRTLRRGHGFWGKACIHKGKSVTCFQGKGGSRLSAKDRTFMMSQMEVEWGNWPHKMDKARTLKTSATG